MKLKKYTLPSSRIAACSSVPVLIAMGAIASFAQAQTPSTPAAAPATEAQQVEKVIVTSNRRNEEQQKVSGVVQAVSGEQLRRDGVTEFSQIQNVITGSNIAVQEGNVEVYIRGVGSSNNTELGDPAAASHFNGVYIPRPRGLGLMFFDLARLEVNKGPQGTLYGRNALAGTLNLIPQAPKLGVFEGYAQAEVANRSGAGAEAALNIPVSSSFALRASAYYKKKDAGMKNVSEKNPTESFDARGLKPSGQDENHAVRLSALWYPTDSLRVSVVADAGKEDGTGYPSVNVFRALDGGQRTADDLNLREAVYRGAKGEATNKLSGIMGKVEYDFGSVTAELSGSARKIDFYQRNAATEGTRYSGYDLSAVTYDNFSTVFWETKSDSTIGEFRLSSNDENARLKWSAGVFTFKEDQKSGFFSMIDRGIFYSGTEFTMPIVEANSTAGYADATFSLTKSSRVIAGLRHSTEEKYRYGIGGNWVLGLGANGGDCCFSTRLGTEGFRPALLNRTSFNVTNLTYAQQVEFMQRSVGTPGARDTWLRQLVGECFARPDIDDNGRVTCPPGGGYTYGDPLKGIPGQQEGRSKANYSDFRFGFEHELNRDQMVYGKIASGHKAGGFNDTFALFPIPETFKPEKLINYEIGSRNAFGSGRNRSIFNATGFYYDYTDQVFQDLTCISNDSSTGRCNGYSLVNRNVGKSRVTGLELEYKTNLSASTKLDVNAVFLNTKISEGIVADARSQSFANNAGGRTTLIDLKGNKLPYTSPFTLNVRLQQEFSLGRGKFDWQALLNYRSAYYLSQYNERSVTYLDGSTKTAREAGFPDKQKGYATLNLSAGYTMDKLRFEAYINNVTNVEASVKALVGAEQNIRFLNDARNFGLRVKYSF